MTPQEFHDIRRLLGLTQAELATVLGYTNRNSISMIEAGRVVPPLVERLMRAYEAGYRPADWPQAPRDAAGALAMLG